MCVCVLGGGAHEAGERGHASTAAAVRAGGGRHQREPGRAAAGVRVVARGQARALPEHAARDAARRAPAALRRARPPLVHRAPGRTPLASAYCHLLQHHQYITYAVIVLVQSHEPATQCFASFMYLILTYYTGASCS